MSSGNLRLSLKRSLYLTCSDINMEVGQNTVHLCVALQKGKRISARVITG